MAKIKINELKNAVKLSEDKSIKSIIFNGLEIEVLQQTNLQDKINLVGTIFESAINRDNGLHILNHNSLNLAFRILLVEKYSNLTLPKDYMQSYDLLTSSGLYDLIYEAIPVRELSDLNVVLENYIETKRDEYEQKNSIQYIIKDGLNKLIEKMPDEEGMAKMISEAKKTVDGFDSDKMEFVKQFLAKTSGEVIG